MSQKVNHFNNKGGQKEEDKTWNHMCEGEDRNKEQNVCFMGRVPYFPAITFVVRSFIFLHPYIQRNHAFAINKNSWDVYD